MVNFVPLKKSYQETLNQYLNNILNSLQFLRRSVQNIEENIIILLTGSNVKSKLATSSMYHILSRINGPRYLESFSLHGLVRNAVSAHR